MQITKIKDIKEYTRNMGVKGIVYINSNLLSVLDNELFFPYVIDLKVKSKAWKSIKNKALGMIGNAIKNQMHESYTVKYNEKAGCNCGCSPGFVVKRDVKVSYKDLSPSLDFTEMWIDADFSEDEMNDFRNNNYSKFKHQVMGECLKNN
jgi:hypothetical protein